MATEVDTQDGLGEQTCGCALEHRPATGQRPRNLQRAASARFPGTLAAPQSRQSGLLCCCPQDIPAAVTCRNLAAKHQMLLARSVDDPIITMKPVILQLVCSNSAHDPPKPAVASLWFQ